MTLVTLVDGNFSEKAPTFLKKRFFRVIESTFIYVDCGEFCSPFNSLSFAPITSIFSKKIFPRYWISKVLSSYSNELFLTFLELYKSDSENLFGRLMSSTRRFF